MENISAFERIKNYFYNFYKFGCASQTETLNFLNDYMKYLLEANEIYENDINVTIHLCKKIDRNQDYIYKPTKKQKEIQSYFKEHSTPISLKEKINRKPKDLAFYCEYGNNRHIYIRESLAKIKTLNDIYNLMNLLLDFGHEVQHMVQYLYNSPKLYHSEERELHLENVQLHALQNGNKQQKKLVNKLIDKRNMFNDFLSTQEIYAEQNSYLNLMNLLEDIATLDEDREFSECMLQLDDDVLKEYKKHLEYLKRIEKRYNEFIENLPKNPHVKKEDLTII